MKSICQSIERSLSPDLGLLILRVAVGGLMLLHGIHKAIHGVGFMKGMFASKGFPEFIAYGVYLGEIIAPVLLIFGIFSRTSALLIAGTMAVAIYMAHSGDIFSLTKNGGSAIELQLLFLLGSLTIVFTGGGKFSLKKGIL